jgi:hypothetical protein
MKTIKWLNEHWWYRAIKVIYIIFLFIVSICVATSIYIGSTESEKTVVYCDNGKRIIKNYSYFTEKEKYTIYRECSEGDFWISQSTKITGKILSENKSKDLDLIIINMENKGYSTKDIQSYVDNYRETYGSEFDPSKYGAVKTEKGKSYTFEEVFGNVDISNGFISKIDGVSILANYKISLEKKFSIIEVVGFMLAGIILTITVFESGRRIFYYIFLGTIKPLKQ